MKRPQPVLVTDLFAPTLEALLELLRSLSGDDWQRPTVCVGWSVKDLAAHLLGGEVGILSRQRDGYPPAGKPITGWEELVALINQLNKSWVEAARRLSPSVLCDLLEHTGAQTCVYFGSLDPFAMGCPVSWAGDEAAPVWLDLAREYTERWHHQQQIRDAVGRPGLKEKRFFAPVLDAFARALPHTYRKVEAAEQTLVRLTVSGAAGARWALRREAGKWNLYVDDGADEAQPHTSDAEVIIGDDLAWRLFTKGTRPESAVKEVVIKGDVSLAMTALQMISIIG